MSFPDYERDYKPDEGKHGYEAWTEMVPIDKLKPYREHRWTRMNNRLGGPEGWDHLKNSIQNEGVFWPLIFMYNPHNGHGYLGEGNHRLAIAEELGMTHVPVRVMRSRGLQPGDYRGVNRIPSGPVVPGHEYFPGDAKPSTIFPAEWFNQRTAGGAGMFKLSSHDIFAIEFEDYMLKKLQNQPIDEHEEGQLRSDLFGPVKTLNDTFDPNGIPDDWKPTPEYHYDRQDWEDLVDKLPRIPSTHYRVSDKPGTKWEPDPFKRD